MGRFVVNSKWPPLHSKKRSLSHIVVQGIIYIDMCNLKTGEMLTIRKLIISSCI